MNRIVGIFSMFFPAIFSGFVFAEPEYTDEAVPTNFHVFSQIGGVYVDHKPTGCSGPRYYIPTDHPRLDTIMSLLIAAQIAGKKVVIRFDGCNANNQGRLIGVYLRN